MFIKKDILEKTKPNLITNKRLWIPSFVFWRISSISMVIKYSGKKAFPLKQKNQNRGINSFYFLKNILNRLNFFGVNWKAKKGGLK